jgi:nucleoside-diphosphate-sugar epimerase
MTKSQSKISFFDLPQDDPLVREPNIDKAKDLLGWQPKINLEHGLQNTIKYFTELISN